MLKNIVLVCVLMLSLGFLLVVPSVSAEECIIPESGPWPSCATGGDAAQNPAPPSGNNDCIIPESGPWPPCATGGTAPNPPSNGNDGCIIPDSGPWPPCATGSDSAAEAPAPAPPAATAHVFPTTPVQPFDKDVFINEVRNLQTSFADLDHMYELIDAGYSGNCVIFSGLYKVWREDRLGFTDVPSQFNALYVEYRAMIQEAVATTGEIEAVCANGGGEVSDETDARILAFLERVLPRIEAMIAEASVIR